MLVVPYKSYISSGGQLGFLQIVTPPDFTSVPKRMNKAGGRSGDKK
jgi:hypothetical protein